MKTGSAKSCEQKNIVNGKCLPEFKLISILFTNIK